MADRLLLAEGLSKVYDSGEASTRALDDVSFEFSEGEFAAIIGQSGSGKSTLLNLLGLLTRQHQVRCATEITKLGRSAQKPAPNCETS